MMIAVYASSRYMATPATQREGAMANEEQLKKMMEMVNTMTMRVLELPEDQRSAWIDRQVVFLKSGGKFPDGWPEKIAGYVRARLAEISSTGGASIVGSA
jgi:hypothetical protein